MIITKDVLQQHSQRVLERLSELAVLPKMGTVAGQSVASLFFEELGLDIKGPINDVDIFVPMSMPREERGMDPLPPYHDLMNPDEFDLYSPKMRKSTTSSQAHQLETRGDDYAHIKFICERQGVNLLRTYKDGLRNFTLYKTELSEMDDTDDISYNIVNGFDMNCVGIGFNLKTQELVVTEHFLEFLNTKTIQIVTSNTPVHSLIRLHKKTDPTAPTALQGITSNTQQQREMVETNIQVVHAVKELKHLLVMQFGQQMFNSAQPYQDVLPPLVRTTPDNEYPLHTFDQTHMTPNRVCQQLMDNLDVWSNKNFHNEHTIARHALLYHFPALYSHLETHSDEHNALFFQTLRETKNEAEAFVVLNNVLHGCDLSSLDRMNIYVENKVELFHKYPRMHDVEHINAVIDAYNSWNYTETLVFHTLFKSPEDILLYNANKKTAQNRYFSRYGMLALTQGFEGRLFTKDSPDEQEILDYLSDFISFQKNSDEYGAWQMRSLDVRMTPPLLSRLSENTRIDVIQKLFSIQPTVLLNETVNDWGNGDRDDDLNVFYNTPIVHKHLECLFVNNVWSDDIFQSIPLSEQRHVVAYCCHHHLSRFIEFHCNASMLLERILPAHTIEHFLTSPTDNLGAIVVILNALKGEDLLNAVLTHATEYTSDAFIDLKRRLHERSLQKDDRKGFLLLDKSEPAYKYSSLENEVLVWLDKIILESALNTELNGSTVAKKRKM